METRNHFFRPNPVGMLNTKGGHLIYIVFVAQDVLDAPKDNQIWISGDIDCKEANFLRWYNVIVFKCAQGSYLILIHHLPITGRIFSISPNSYPNYAIQLKKNAKATHPILRTDCHLLFHLVSFSPSSFWPPKKS